MPELVLLVCLSEELLPVGNGTHHVAGIDEVERAGVVPFLLNIVDLKSDATC